MLKSYLEQAIEKVEQLIQITICDIKNIKEAKHSEVAQSVKDKSVLIKEFEDIKRALDKELVKISKVSNSESLSDVLDDDVKQLLVTMRHKLQELHDTNREYAKYVVIVKEFFDSLSKEMFGVSTDGYNKNATTNSVYKARV